MKGRIHEAMVRAMNATPTPVLKFGYNRAGLGEKFNVAVTKRTLVILGVNKKTAEIEAVKHDGCPRVRVEKACRKLGLQ